MELDETTEQPPAGMPGKVTAALVVMWCIVGVVLLATAAGWFALSITGELGDYLYFYPAQMLWPPMLAAGVAVVAVRFRRRENWARITGVVLGVTGGLCSTSVLSTGISFVIAAVLYWVMFGMLLTGDAKAWCGRPPRGGGRGPDDPHPPAL